MDRRREAGGALRDRASNFLKLQQDIYILGLHRYIRVEYIGNPQGFLQKDLGDTKMIPATGWTSSSRGYDYYEALFEQIKSVTTVDQKESLYLKDYSNYLRVLGRFRS